MSSSCREIWRIFWDFFLRVITRAPGIWWLPFDMFSARPTWTPSRTLQAALASAVHYVISLSERGAVFKCGVSSLCLGFFHALISISEPECLCQVMSHEVRRQSIVCDWVKLAEVSGPPPRWAVDSPVRIAIEESTRSHYVRWLHIFTIHDSRRIRQMANFEYGTWTRNYSGK